MAAICNAACGGGHGAGLLGGCGGGAVVVLGGCDLWGLWCWAMGGMTTSSRVAWVLPRLVGAPGGALSLGSSEFFICYNITYIFHCEITLRLPTTSPQSSGWEEP